jgi:hypothetical protein
MYKIVKVEPWLMHPFPVEWSNHAWQCSYEMDLVLEKEA